MAINKFTENDLATELIAIELIAEASKQGVRLSLARAKTHVLLGRLCLLDVLGAKDL